jgi:hypothetical protein
LRWPPKFRQCCFSMFFYCFSMFFYGRSRFFYGFSVFLWFFYVFLLFLHGFLWLFHVFLWFSRAQGHPKAILWRPARATCFGLRVFILIHEYHCRISKGRCSHVWFKAVRRFNRASLSWELLVAAGYQRYADHRRRVGELYLRCGAEFRV